MHEQSRVGPSLLQVIGESLGGLLLQGRRSVLTLLGIAVGSASVVAVLNIGQNAANESAKIFKGLGAHTLIATFPARPNNTLAAPSRLDTQAASLALPQIEHIAPITPHSARVFHKRLSTEAIVVGTTSDLASLLGLRVDQGRFLSDYDRLSTYAVVGSGVEHKLAQQGASLSLGDQLQVDGYLFEVIGVAAGLAPNPLIPVEADESIFVPIEGMRRLRRTPEIGSIIAQAHDAAPLISVAANLKTYLETIAGGREVDVQVPRLLLESLTRQASTFTYMLASLGGISLLVGGVGVMNVMLMNVAERRREIGLRMALGAKAADIRNIFLIEAATLSATGALLGSFFGLTVAYIFSGLQGWTFSLEPWSLPLGICSSLVIGMIFGLSPALSAAKMQPVQALRDD